MEGITRASIRARVTNRKVRAAETVMQVQSMLPYTVRGAVWLILYLLFILAPLFALLAGTLPPTRDFWTEFSVAIGYAGLAMMGLQFGLTAPCGARSGTSGTRHGTSGTSCWRWWPLRRGWRTWWGGAST